MRGKSELWSVVLGSKSAVGLSGVEEHTLMQALPLGPFTPPCREQSVRREIALSLPMIVNAAFSLSHQKHFPLILVVVAHFARSDPSTQGGRIPLHCISVVCAPALCSAPADGRGGHFFWKREEPSIFLFYIVTEMIVNFSGSPPWLQSFKCQFSKRL